MKTDRERWVEFFAKYGLRAVDESAAKNTLTFRQGHGGVGGYQNFEAEVKFDVDGNFLAFGVWE